MRHSWCILYFHRFAPASVLRRAIKAESREAITGNRGYHDDNSQQDGRIKGAKKMRITNIF